MIIGKKWENEKHFVANLLSGGAENVQRKDVLDGLKTVFFDGKMNNWQAGSVEKFVVYYLGCFFAFLVIMTVTDAWPRKVKRRKI